jgi:sporulation protein YlmC with PRC-barrel domain
MLLSDLQLGMPVRGSDEPIGTLDALVCDPTDNEVTHIVVRADDVPGADRLVSVADVAQVSDAEVTLDISRREFFERETFETAQFLPERAEEYAGDESRRWMLPFVGLAEHGATFATHERIPRSDVALKRGTKVVDADGKHLGSVHAFAFDPSTQDISHLVMAAGHILHRRDVTIPIASVDHLGEDEIRLSITADDVEELPHVPLAH